MKLKNSFKVLFLFLILNASFLHGMFLPFGNNNDGQEQSNQNVQLQPNSKPQPNFAQRYFAGVVKSTLDNNKEHTTAFLRAVLGDQELRRLIKEALKEILQDKEVVEAGATSAKILLRDVISDARLTKELKEVLKSILRDQQIAGAARGFVENAANKSILSTKNLLILLWIIPAAKASKDLATYAAKHLSNNSLDKGEWNKVIKSRHSKLLAIALAGIVTSQVQGFVIERLVQGVVWTTKNTAYLIRYMLFS